MQPDRWDSGDDYDRFMGRWSRMVAVDFLRWLAVPPGASWLDVGTGTGALLHAVASTASPQRLAGVDRSEAFLAVAAQGPGRGADLRVADAGGLPSSPGRS